MADHVGRLLQVSACVGLFHQLLHMVFAEQVNVQLGGKANGVRRAGFAGGAQQYVALLAPGFGQRIGHAAAHGLHVLAKCGQFIHKIVSSQRSSGW